MIWAASEQKLGNRWKKYNILMNEYGLNINKILKKKTILVRVTGIQTSDKLQLQL